MLFCPWHGLGHTYQTSLNCYCAYNCLIDYLSPDSTSITEQRSIFDNKQDQPLLIRQVGTINIFSLITLAASCISPELKQQSSSQLMWMSP